MRRDSSTWLWFYFRTKYHSVPRSYSHHFLYDHPGLIWGKQLLSIISGLSHASFCVQFVSDLLLTCNIKQGSLQTDSLRWSPYSSGAGQHAVLHTDWSFLSRSLCWVFKYWLSAKCPQAVALCLIILLPKISGIVSETTTVCWKCAQFQVSFKS